MVPSPLEMIDPRLLSPSPLGLDDPSPLVPNFMGLVDPNPHSSQSHRTARSQTSHDYRASIQLRSLDPHPMGQVFSSPSSSSSLGRLFPRACEGNDEPALAEAEPHGALLPARGARCPPEAGESRVLGWNEAPLSRWGRRIQQEPVPCQPCGSAADALVSNNSAELQCVVEIGCRSCQEWGWDGLALGFALFP